MDNAQAFRDQLAALEQTSMRRRPATADQIAIGSTLSESFEAMTVAERTSARELASKSNMGKKLLSLSGYIAEVAINLSRPDLLRVGLVLQAIEGLESDYRENTRYLILIAFAACNLGVALRPIVGSVLGLAPEHGRARLEEFASREFRPEELKAFGLKIDGAPGGFRFVPIA